MVSAKGIPNAKVVENDRRTKQFHLFLPFYADSQHILSFNFDSFSNFYII